MKPIAPHVHQFQFLWPNAFNAYYLEGDNESIVVDASTRWDWLLMRRQLRDRPVTGVLLTHAHPDHQGCAADFLNVSRPFVIKEIDEGRIPCQMVGTHRRIALNDLLAYKRQCIEKHNRAMDELVQQAQELNLGY